MIVIRKFLLCFAPIFFLTASVSAQSGVVRGFVYVKKTSEPEPFVNVYLDKDIKFGTSTDINGYFNMAKVPVGKYTLYVQSVGFELLELPIEVKKSGEIVSRKLYLEEGNFQFKGVDIDGRKTEMQTQIKISEITATPTIMGYVPTAGGEADIATYMQTLPGVVFTGDQGGQLYIRGGSPIQNKVLLDGMVVYNPFHSIGFFSVFDTDIIRSADIYTGGFNAEYGSRISSVMDITTRDGNKKDFAGKVSVSPFMTKLMLEGPIKKEKDGGSAITYLLSGKTSYLEQTSKVLYTPINGVDSLGLPFNFTDLYGKISFNGGNGSKFNVFGFNYTDRVKYQAVQNFGWDSWGLGSNFVLVPANSPLLMTGNFSLSEYGITMEEQTTSDAEESKPRSSKINGFNFGLDFKYFFAEDELKYGIDVSGYNTDFAFYNSVGREISQNENTTELGAYIVYKMNHKNIFLLEPSMRVQYYSSLAKVSPEPRLGFKWNINEDLRFKMAGGIYSQNLMSANSDRDVVNLFYGFLAGPSNLQDEFTNQAGETSDLTHSLQKANHAILGFEYDFNEYFNINIEGYKKWFTQLTNMNRNKIFEDSPNNNARPDVLKKDFIVETGEAQGVDMVLSYQKDNLYLWGVYSLGKVTRWDGFQEYAPIFDRRHNVNLVASYGFGRPKDLEEDRENKDPLFEVTARWNLGTGLPFTQTQGYFELQNFEGGINTDVTNTNGELGIIYADLGKGRLPVYHRLDLNVRRSFQFEKSKLEVNLGVTNAYSRKNIFYVNRITQERVDQLPILPSIGINWAW